MLNLIIKTSYLPLQHVRIVGDSQCTIAAFRYQGSALRPHFLNCVTEAQETMQEIEDMTGREVEVRLTAVPLNPADLITRGAGIVMDNGHCLCHLAERSQLPF